MKKNIMLISVAVIVIIAIISIHLANDTTLTEPAELTTVENRISASGFIVRDEYMYYATADGTPYFNLPEGRRVSKDALIATIFGGDADEDSLKELSLLDMKLRRAYEEEQKMRLHRSDSGSLENDVKSRVSELYDYAETGNIEKITETREIINSLRTTGEYSIEIKTEELENEKRAVEKKIGLSKKEIFSEISGIFTRYTDGLEAVLEPEKIEQYTPSYIKNLSESDAGRNEGMTVKVGDPICKVMNNHVWYFTTVIHKDELSELKKGNSVGLRFKNMADVETQGVVEYMSEPDANGDVLVMVRCSTYIESVFSYRRADAELIFKRYTGYKVPVHAIRPYDGGYRVTAQSGSQIFECDVEVLYTDSENGYCIVKSTENAVNKLTKAERIVVGEKK